MKRIYLLILFSLLVQGPLKAQADGQMVENPDEVFKSAGPIDLKISKMKSENVVRLIKNVGARNCVEFADMTIQSDASNDLRPKLNIRLKTKVKSKLASLKNIPNDLIWNGLVEISLLLEDIYVLKDEIRDRYDIQARGTYLGSGAGVTTKEQEQIKEKRISDDWNQTQESVKKIKNKIDKLRRRGICIAAFVLNEIPDEKRRGVIDALRTYKDKSSSDVFFDSLYEFDEWPTGAPRK